MNKSHAPGASDPILSVNNVGMRFGGLEALSGVTFGLRRGHVTGLIGPNGAGKSTLVNVLSGLAAPTSGELSYQGKPVSRWALGSAARQGVTRSFQASRVFSEMTVMKNITLGGLHKTTRDEALRILAMLDLESRERTLASNLSYGELRRLGVGIALASKPNVVLLDEPGAGLTGKDLDSLSRVVAQMSEEGITVLLIDHNMRFVMKSVETVLVLEGGRLIAQGTPSEIQADAAVRRAYLGGGSDA